MREKRKMKEPARELIFWIEESKGAGTGWGRREKGQHDLEAVSYSHRWVFWDQQLDSETKIFACF